MMDLIKLLSTFYLQIKYQKVVNRLDLINNSKNITNSAVLQIQQRYRSGEITSRISNILISGLKNSLNSGEISSKLVKANSIQVVIRSSLVKKTDERIYYFFNSGLELKVHLRQEPNLYLKIVLIVICSCVALFLVYSKSNQASKVSRSNSIFVNLPMSTCGDLTSGGQNTWYPVYIPYSKQSFSEIRKKFCCDASYSSKNNAIQVASFLDKKRASQLVEVLKNKGFAYARVGYGTLTTTKASLSPRTRCSNHR